MKKRLFVIAPAAAIFIVAALFLIKCQSAISDKIEFITPIQKWVHELSRGRVEFPALFYLIKGCKNGNLKIVYIKPTNMAKILIVYYSRTGITKKLAEYLAQALGADIEEVFTEKDRQGMWGYISSGKEASQKKTTRIKPTQKDPGQYDLVVYGTPIWSFNVSSPIRTVLAEQKDKIKQAAFFCTMGGSGDLRAFNDMTTVIGKSPVATLSLKTKDVFAGRHVEMAKDFIAKLQQQ